MTLYLFALLFKHSIADLWFQSRLNNPKYGDKARLRDPKLWLHSLDHAGLSAIITLFFAGFYVAIIIFVLDFVLHSLIDYSKRIYVLRKKITMKSRTFWKIQSIDQIAHYTCYLAYAFIVF